MDERDQQRKIRHRIAVLRHAAEVTGRSTLAAGECNEHDVMFAFRHIGDVFSP